MANKWRYHSSKEILMIWIIGLVIGIGTFIFNKQNLIRSNSLTDSVMSFVIIAILVLAAWLFLAQGIRGLITGKASGLSSKFSTEYRMERGKIAVRYKEYQGILGILRSLISIVIGLAILLVCGVIGIMFLQIF